jgi:hypothetical protein
MMSKTWFGRVLLAACVFGSSSCAMEAGQVPEGAMPPYDDDLIGVTEAAAILAPAPKGSYFGDIAVEEFPAAGGKPAFGIKDITNDVIDKLAAKGVALAVHWPSTKLDPVTGKELIDFVKRAQARNLEVRPWLLLPEGTGPAAGYFASSDNYAAFIAAGNKLINLWAKPEVGLKPTVFGVDMELRRDRLDAVLKLQAAKDDLGSASLLATYVNRAQFTAATAAYKKFVQDAQLRGWKVQVVTLPQLLDDDNAADHDDDLHQAFNCPIKGIPWDSISFMTFRTLFSGISGTKLTAEFVRSYSDIAYRTYGAKASVTVGVTDPGVTTGVPTYDSAAEMREDIVAACQSGIVPSKVGLYSLRGVIASSKGIPFESWFSSKAVPDPTKCKNSPIIFPAPGPTEDMHTKYRLLDHSLGLLTLGK